MQVGVSGRRDSGSGAQEGSLSCQSGEWSVGEELKTPGLVEVILGENGEVRRDQERKKRSSPKTQMELLEQWEEIPSRMRSQGRGLQEEGSDSQGRGCRVVT